MRLYIAACFSGSPPIVTSLAMKKQTSFTRQGNQQEQTAHPVVFLVKFKTILCSHFRTKWKERLHVQTQKDSIIYNLERAQQVTIFRLRTGHCQLLSHLYRLKISHADECPCGPGQQTPDHILQSCPTFDDLRRQTWPSPVELSEKLWGTAGSLQRTADFVRATGLTIYYSMARERRRRRRTTK